MNLAIIGDRSELMTEKEKEMFIFFKLLLKWVSPSIGRFTNLFSNQTSFQY
jgi:hypothetical protein